jgi:leucine dehydrogenase
MALIASETRWVAGLTRGAGDPSPFTAAGVCRAIEAAAHAVWGHDRLEGRRIAIQGLGNVGRRLAALLDARGARLIVADIDAARTAAVVAAHRAIAVSPDAVLEAEADVLAPCALGGILNDDTIPRLRAAVVAGAANNQLLDARHGDALAARGILYVPDYVANAGGVISGAVDIAGWDRARMDEQLDGIYATVHEVLARAREWGVAPHTAADRLAEARIAAARRT